MRAESVALVQWTEGAVVCDDVGVDFVCGTFCGFHRIPVREAFGLWWCGYECMRREYGRLLGILMGFHVMAWAFTGEFREILSEFR